MYLAVIPQQVGSGGEAHQPAENHPDTGDGVDAALGYGSDTAPLAPAAAHERVEAEGEAAYPGEGEQDAEGRGGGHELLGFPGVPCAHHPGEEGAEAGVSPQWGELEGALEVLGVALAGVHGLLDVGKGACVVAAPGPDAGERRE